MTAIVGAQSRWLWVRIGTFYDATVESFVLGRPVRPGPAAV